MIESKLVVRVESSDDSSTILGPIRPGLPSHQSLPTPFEPEGGGSGGLRRLASRMLSSAESSLAPGEPASGEDGPLPPAPPAPRIPEGGVDPRFPPGSPGGDGACRSEEFEGSPSPRPAFEGRGEDGRFFEPGVSAAEGSEVSGGGLTRFAANSRLAAASDRTASSPSPPSVDVKQAS